jgi:hypothetical protein
MPITHKFIETNFLGGFQTHDAILDVTPYKPEVMVIGTFNPGTPNARADFFYGRNYFWPAFKNLFIEGRVGLTNTRMPLRGVPPPHNLLNPTLAEIFCLCIKLKLTFADLIDKVLQNNNPQYELLPNDHVIFNGQEYNLITDDNNGLLPLDGFGQVNWNTQNIIKYLCDNPQIKTIYFTRKPTGIWQNQWNQIVNHPCIKGRQLTNIYTPSGRRLRKPVMNSLLHHWVHNNTPGFGKLDTNWLIDNRVEIEGFMMP